jgi:hypothetical protein
VTKAVERITRSWWVVLTLAPLGMLSFGAFLYAGIRARVRRWIVAGAVYAFVVYVGFILATTDEDGVLSDVGVTLVLLAWAASFAHALSIRGAFLERMELVEGRAYDHAEDRVLERVLDLPVPLVDRIRADVVVLPRGTSRSRCK